MTHRTVAQELAACITARAGCKAKGSSHADWFANWTARIDSIAKDCLPSGSGVDHGTSVDLDRSNDERIVLNTSFHHMDEYGGYDGWTEHTVTVRPDWTGVQITISGRDRNGIKDYLSQMFHDCLNEQLVPYSVGGTVTYKVVRRA